LNPDSFSPTTQKTHSSSSIISTSKDTIRVQETPPSHRHTQDTRLTLRLHLSPSLRVPAPSMPSHSTGSSGRLSCDRLASGLRGEASVVPILPKAVHSPPRRAAGFSFGLLMSRDYMRQREGFVHFFHFRCYAVIQSRSFFIKSQRPASSTILHAPSIPSRCQV
jgi:hypothetical protein